MDITTGATLTGGSTVALSPAGVMPGKSVFVGPDHTRSEPNTVEWTVSGSAINAKPGQKARTGLKITFVDRETAEGCCSTETTDVIIDLGVRASYNVPTAVIDKAIDYLQGLVFTAAFENAVKKALLPSA